MANTYPHKLFPRLLKSSVLHHTRRCSSSLAEIQTELPRRQIPLTWDDLTASNSHRLSVSLSDFLPPSSPAPALVLPRPAHDRELPVGHHLVYFEPCRRTSDLLPDGTNPDQSPGPLWPRRMWAGGSVRLNPRLPLVLDGSRAVCAEFIRAVHGTGDKVFVRTERRLARASADEVARAHLACADESGRARAHLEHRVRQRLWRDSEDDPGDCSVLDTRTLVFLPRASALAGHEQRAEGKILRPTHAEPDFAHVVVPTKELLFRFSALTWNAHAIHLDAEYAREVEGHRRGLLVHGPLAYTFLVTLLQHHLARSGSGAIRSVEYRNLAPLYCGEEVRFCGKRTRAGRWEVWAEGPQGGVAVKGTATTEEGMIDRAN